MGFFVNGKKIEIYKNKDIKTNLDKTYNDFYENNEVCIEEDSTTVIKKFSVLHMSFVGDGEDTFKIMLLNDIETNKRYYLEVCVYDYYCSNEYNAKLVDVITLMEGDTVEIKMEEFEDELDIDFFIEVKRL